MIELYFAISILVGLIIIFDAYVLLKNNGNTTKTNNITGSVELFWFFLTVGALIKNPFDDYQILIPLLYVTYNVLGWICAFFIVKINSEKPMKMNLPIWYVYFCLYVGCVFTISSIRALSKVFL